MKYICLEKHVHMTAGQVWRPILFRILFPNQMLLGNPQAQCEDSPIPLVASMQLVLIVKLPLDLNICSCHGCLSNSRYLGHLKNGGYCHNLLLSHSTVEQVFGGTGVQQQE